MKTTVISADDLRKIVHKIGLDQLMDMVIDRLTSSIIRLENKQTIIPVRSGFKYSHPQLGLIEWMPGMITGKGVYIKVVGYHPLSGQTYKLPTILSTQSLYSVDDGHLVALMDASFATAIRTGAASAIASRILAKPDSNSLGIIGCGAQAVTQLHALSRIFPLTQVFLFDTNDATMHSFSSRIQALKLDSLSLQSGQVADWIDKIDILITATSVDIGEGPVFADQNLPAHIHINAIGSDFPGKFELPKSVLERAIVFPDFTEQAIVEGECQHLMPENIGPDLYTLVSQPTKFSQAQHQTTVFDSTGWALEDIVTINVIYELAEKYGIGRQILLESISSDPRNPYQFLTE